MPATGGSFIRSRILILSLNLEAGELLELTQWRSEDAFEREAAG